MKISLLLVSYFAEYLAFGTGLWKVFKGTPAEAAAAFALACYVNVTRRERTE